MAKGGSKVLTAVISFLLGFIFAILVEIGAVVGVYFYVSNTKLDTLFSNMGLNNIDENGNYVYVNTDSDNGGASDVGELLEKLKGYLYTDGSSTMDYPVLGKSLEEIGNLLPIVQNTVAEKLYPALNQYLDLDLNKFETVPLSELPQFLSDSVMDIRPAKLLAKFGMDGLVGDDANILVKSLLAGVEFDYARTDSGLKFPVYYDSYVYNEQLDRYYREEAVNGQQAFPSNLSESLLFKAGTQSDEGETQYRLYYIPCNLDGNILSDATLAEGGDTLYSEGTTFIAVERTGNKTYNLNFRNLEQFEYLNEYGLHNMDRTGNFYYTNGNEEKQIHPVTIGSFSKAEEVFKPLYSVGIVELIGGGENGIVADIFGNLSVGELIDGKADIDDMVSNLVLPNVLTIDPEQTLMAYIGYGLTNVKAVNEAGWQYEGQIKVDGVVRDCKILYELKGEPAQRSISRVWYYDENGASHEIKGTKVKEVSSLASSMEITALLDVKADDAVIAYLGYGVSNVVERAGDNYTHVGKYDIVEESNGTAEKVTKTVDCFIDTDENGIITNLWYVDENGFDVLIGGTTIDTISDKVSGIMEHLAITDVMDVAWDNSIMVYMGYGVTSVRAQSGEDYSYVGKVEVDGEKVPCYIVTDESGNITEIFRKDGNTKISVSGTKIEEVADRVGNVMKNLTLPDLIDIDVDDPIMGYIGYGVSGVKKQSDEGYNRTAKFKKDDNEYEAYLYVNEDGKVENAWYVTEHGTEDLEGTVIDGISDIISSLSDNLALPDVLDVTADGAVTAYIGYSITKINPADGDGYTHTAIYTEEDGTEHECFVLTDEKSGKITEVWYFEDGQKVFVNGTTINQLPSKIDGISENLTLSDVMDITEDDSILWALRDSKINEVGKQVKELKIKDVLDAEDIAKSSILSQLANKSVKELSTAIDAISIQSIYAQEIYKLATKDEDPKEVTEYRSDILYFTLQDGVFVYVKDGAEDDEVGTLTLQEYEEGVASGVTYYSYGEAVGMWRLILFKDGREKVYTLNNFNNMINTSTANINNATLGTLQEAGIISASANLNKQLTYLEDNVPVTVTLSELKLRELIDVVIGMSK